jgi:hypothetical protein
MMPADNIAQEVAAKGFAIVEVVLAPNEVGDLLSGLERLPDSESMRKHGSIFAVRNLFDVFPEILALAQSPQVRHLVDAILGVNSFPVRGILFDKTPNANWKVPWHQDVTIAVHATVEAEGFGPWSMKAGVLHVQPPAHVLENMISLRLHLDNCDENNGALRVLPGSHLHGRIPEDRVAAIRAGATEYICEVGAGGALLMRPLLLHASSPSRLPQHRRVVHIDYASVDLPSGMCWLSERTILSPINS